MKSLKFFSFFFFLMFFDVFVYAEGCNGLLTQEAAELIVELVNIVRIAVPILLIILCSTDFVSIVTGQDEKVVKVATGRIVKRFIAAAAFFFVPLIVSFILGIDAVKNSLNLVDDPLCGIDDGSIDGDGYLKEEEVKGDSGLENNANNGENNSNNSSVNNKNDDIGQVSNDGVIVKVKISIEDDIRGYYFSYSNEEPNKANGYLETSQKTIDVVRLPGTTYIWVETVDGDIRGPVSINLSNSVIQLTMKKGTILKGKNLDSYLSSKGGNIKDLSNIITRSVRAAGLYTKEGAATAAVALQMVLMQQYNLKISYQFGGKHQVYGASRSWGGYFENKAYPGHNTIGFDCGGFVNWSYFNTGIEWKNFTGKNYFFYWEGLPYSESNGEVGDILRRFATNSHYEHVAIIVGKTDSAFLVAEAYGLDVGVIINTYPYDKANDYTIIKGERLIEEYTKVANSQFPSGF